MTYQRTQTLWKTRRGRRRAEREESQERSHRTADERRLATISSWTTWKPRTQMFPGFEHTWKGYKFRYYDQAWNSIHSMTTRPSQHVIGVFIHEAEVLEMDFLVSHPVVKVKIHLERGLFLKTTPMHSFCWRALTDHYLNVKVSLVNGDTGELVDKTDPGRRVTSFYEGTNVSSILPLMTQPFDFR